MEILIAKWIREVIVEYDLAKANQNLYRMEEMRYLRDALQDIRDKLLKRRSY